MAQKLTASMPPDIDLPPNWIVQLTAVDATTGALVSNVNVSNVAIIGSFATSAVSDEGGGFVPTTPLWLATPVDG